MNETKENGLLYSFKDVFYSIGDKEILSNITVDIKRTEITGVIGPSGSGKSTFLRLLNKLISPTKGELIYQDKKISEIPARVLRKEVGMVQQQPFLFEGTVKENLLYGPKIWNIEYSDEELLSLLEKVALEPEFLEKDVLGLSGGEQQRVSFARSLANNPSVLLLDEPTSSLDLVSEEIIENSIKKLVNEGIKVIIVTHSLEQTQRLTDQLLFLKDGKFKEKTTTKKFFEQYNTEEIRTFFKKEEKENGE